MPSEEVLLKTEKLSIPTLLPNYKNYENNMNSPPRKFNNELVKV
jgi:hypothetical protein